MDFKEPHYKNDDGTYEVTKDGMPYCVNEADTPDVWAEMQKWITENNIQVSERPNEPEKTAEQIKAESIALITNQLNLLDSKSARPLRAIISGTATDDDKSKLMNYENQAISLRAQLAALNK
jgi:hypothetical protein